MESITEKQKEMSDTEIRDCYYVMRAMHDGACPHCGYTAETFENTNGLMCPECEFTMTNPELQGIKKITQQAVKRRVESFEACREILASKAKEIHPMSWENKE